MLNNQGFDKWSGDYDESIQRYSKGYPFAGYYDVLSYVQNSIEFKNQLKILDVGVGTGLLTNELYKQGAIIYGIDFSEKMIEIAKSKMPQGVFFCVDFKSDLPIELKEERFDYIVSSYAFHHLTEAEKVKYISELKKILKENGKIIIADVAFQTMEKLNECKDNAGRAWDGDEHYLVAESLTDCLMKLGNKTKYKQVSFCAGVLEVSKQ